MQADEGPTHMVLLNDIKKSNMIIPLTEKKEDLFIDVFKDDYIKIMKQMQEKKDKLRINDDDMGKARREALAANAKGIRSRTSAVTRAVALRSRRRATQATSLKLPWTPTIR